MDNNLRLQTIAAMLARILKRLRQSTDPKSKLDAAHENAVETKFLRPTVSSLPPVSGGHQ